VKSVDPLLQKISRTVAETFGLAKCTIGIGEKDTELFAVRAAYGFEPDRETEIRKVKYTPDRMLKDLKPEFKVSRNTYYVPAESWELDDEDMVFMSETYHLVHTIPWPSWTNPFDMTRRMLILQHLEPAKTREP